MVRLYIHTHSQNLHIIITINIIVSQETREESTTTSTILLNPIIQSAIIGAVSGALVVGIIATVIIALLIVMMTRRRMTDSKENGVTKGNLKLHLDVMCIATAATNTNNIMFDYVYLYMVIHNIIAYKLLSVQTHDIV